MPSHSLTENVFSAALVDLNILVCFCAHPHRKLVDPERPAVSLYLYPESDPPGLVRMPFPSSIHYPFFPRLADSTPSVGRIEPQIPTLAHQTGFHYNPLGMF